MERYIAYYRVSTTQQGNSGLGIEGQQAAIKGYIGNNGVLQAEFTDIESGKNDNRPELLKALQYAKECDCTLLIAKLDRLSRNLTFISSLMDSKVKFKCCDMPDANNFTIHIFAALAQQEREMISQRTKTALQAAKVRGVKLGLNKDGVCNFTQTNKGRELSVQKRKEKALNNPDTIKARTLVMLLRDKMTLKQLAEHLNAGGFRTPNGKLFRTEQVRRLCLPDVQH